MTNSRISGFYNLTLEERRAKLAEAANQTPEDLIPFTTGGLSAESAEHMIENVIGMYSLPMGIGLNFMVNGRDVLIPFVIEEPSVVAGASFMAKLARAGGGFTATTTEPLMIGQMQLINIVNMNEARLKIYEHKAELLAEADSIDSVLKSFGGGARDLEVRMIEDSPIGPFIVIHLIYDVRDAMGANAINTACEKLAPQIEAITGGKVHLRILSNLADRRIARSRCTIPVNELTVGFEILQRRDRARWHHRRLGFRRDRSIPRRDTQQRHHERRGLGGHRHWQRLARHRSGRAFLCGTFGQVHIPLHLGQGQGRQPGRHAGNANGGGNRRRRNQGPPWRPSRS